MKKCRNYTGVSCVNGTCPVALIDEHAERGMDIIRSCSECHYYEGCDNCIWQDNNACKIREKIMSLIDGYAKRHDLAKECGSEYIYQSDSAQIDALELVANIFDLYAEEMEDE